MMLYLAGPHDGVNYMCSLNNVHDMTIVLLIELLHVPYSTCTVYVCAHLTK